MFFLLLFLLSFAPRLHRRCHFLPRFALRAQRKKMDFAETLSKRPRTSSKSVSKVHDTPHFVKALIVSFLPLRERSNALCIDSEWAKVGNAKNSWPDVVHFHNLHAIPEALQKGLVRPRHLVLDIANYGILPPQWLEKLESVTIENKGPRLQPFETDPAKLLKHCPLLKRFHFGNHPAFLAITSLPPHLESLTGGFACVHLSAELPKTLTHLDMNWMGWMFGESFEFEKLASLANLTDLTLSNWEAPDPAQSSRNELEVSIKRLKRLRLGGGLFHAEWQDTILAPLLRLNASTLTEVQLPCLEVPDVKFSMCTSALRNALVSLRLQILWIHCDLSTSIAVSSWLSEFTQFPSVIVCYDADNLGRNRATTWCPVDAMEKLRLAMPILSPRVTSILNNYKALLDAVQTGSFDHPRPLGYWMAHHFDECHCRVCS